MEYMRWDEGVVICGDAFSPEVNALIDRLFGANETHAHFPFIICDPPYGEIVKDKNWNDIAEYNKWFEFCNNKAQRHATIAMWGGVGKPGKRPFLEWVSQVEKTNKDWESQFVTWAKKRAYGVPDDYLFTREECFIMYRGPRGKTNQPTFNIPLLEQKRGYAGYDSDHPAKSEFLRRTNVWTDITEMFKGKIHQCQKPDKLYEVLINTHSKEGDVIFDPCAGSGTTARACINTGRHFCIVEKNKEYLVRAGLL